MLKDRLDNLPMRGHDAPLFPATDRRSHIAPSTLGRVFYPAHHAADRPYLRWQNLRHAGAVLAAQTGATLVELMVGWGTPPGRCRRYQHAAQGRAAEIAGRLSVIAQESKKRSSDNV